MRLVPILLALVASPADETVIRVDAARALHRVSPLLLGACIEDVNHEIYGGIYSQLLFGESFQEPAGSPPLKGLTTHGGRWRAGGGVLNVGGGDGPKAVVDGPGFAVGEASVEIRLTGQGPPGSNASLIVKVGDPAPGADRFHGYEIALEPPGTLMLGRHRGNWEPLRRVSCPVPLETWITLAVRMRERGFEVLVDGRSLLTFEDDAHPLQVGGVGLRAWQRPAAFRNLRIREGDGPTRAIPLEQAEPEIAGDVSRMWTPYRRGSARGSFALETARPYLGGQSQRLTLIDGPGEVGIENRGLNRWGLALVAGRPYEGVVWARAGRPAEVRVALESADGTALAEARVDVAGDAWGRYEFTLTPTAAARPARFAIGLTGPGSVVLGHASLRPGPWGRFKGLPDRKDVAEGLVDMGLTVLRHGGSMVNHPAYRWKNMVGPRDRRTMTEGHWYPHSTNGWGIVDFLDLCEAAGFVAIPAVNMDETPADLVDLVEYLNGPADSPWGRRRVADGHPAPYRLKHLELGNEEAVNDDYWRKFRPIAEAVWAKDPGLILVVGDFAYGKVIDDPLRFAGGAAVDSLAAHRKILELARERGREVWFDIHISTDRPPEPNGLRPERSYIDWLGKLAPGANYKVAIFEFNSGNHAHRRGLSNALALNEVERVGDLLPVACAANALQPDGQNDNGWDQGLLFLDPSAVWLQSPGYVVRMARRGYQPVLVASGVAGPAGPSVNAKRSDDGQALTLQVVHPGDSPLTARIELAGFAPSRPVAAVETLSGPLDATNTAAEPTRIAPASSGWRHEVRDGATSYTFPPRSFTVIRFE